MGSRRTLAAILIVIVAVSVTGISAYQLINNQNSNQQNSLVGLLALLTGQHRIVSCAPSITEIVFGLGLEDHLVGCTEYCDYPPKLYTLISLGKVDNSLSWYYTSIEDVVALNPTIVLLDDGVGVQVDMCLKLIHQGIFAHLVSRGDSISEIEDSILEVGRLLGRKSAAQSLVNAMETKIQTIEGNVSGQERKNVLMIVYWMGTSLVTCGNSTFLSEMILNAGGLNVYYGSYEDPFPYVSLAEAVAHGENVGGIDVIVVTAMGESSFDPVAIYTEMGSSPEITSTDAWINTEVYFCDFGQADNLLMRPGPRVAEGVELLANMLFHEEVFNKTFPSPIHAINDLNYRNYLTSFILE